MRSYLKSFVSFLTLLFCIGFVNTGKSQDDLNELIADSLVMELSTVESDQKRVDILIEIAQIHQNSQCERSIDYATRALKIAEDTRYLEGVKASSKLIGQAVLYCEMNVTKSLPFLDKSFKLALKLKDRRSELSILCSFAMASYYEEDYKGAIDYYKKALNVAFELKDTQQIISIYDYLADTHIENGEVEKGLSYYQLILEHVESNDYENISAKTLVSLCQYYILIEDYAQAEKHIKSAIEVYQRQHNITWLSYSYSLLAKAQIGLNKNKSAILSAQKGIALAEKHNYNKERLDNYLALKMAFIAANDFENSIKYMEKFYQLKDSIYKAQQSAERKYFQEEFDLIERETELEKNKSELKSKSLEAENDALILRFAIIALLMSLLAVIFIFVRLRYTRQLNKKLQAQKIDLEKLSIVVENIDQTVLIVNNKDQIEWVNQAFKRTFGYAESEVIGKKPSVFLCGDLTDPLTIKEINTKIFKEKVPFETTLLEYNKSGHYFTSQLFVTPLLNESGNLERYVVISKDITEEKKLAEELEELSLVASNTTNSIVIFNKAQEVVWVNQSFTELLGLSFDEVCGKKPLDLYSGPKLKKAEEQKIVEQYNSQKQFTQEVKSINRKTKHEFWLSINVTPVFDAYGLLEKYISIATDISEIKSLENQYASFVEESSDMIYEIDISGYFVFVNEVLARLSGYKKEVLKQTFYLELVRPDFKEKVSDFYVSQIKNMVETNYLEFPIIAKDGSELWVGQVANMIKNETGDKATGFKIIARDITDKKIAEAKLQKAYLNSNLLSEIGMQITATLSVEDIILQVYDNINELMDANVFGIGFPNREGNALKFPMVIENGVKLTDISIPMDDDKRLAIHCYVNAKEIFIGNFPLEVHTYIENIDEIIPVAGESPLSTVYLPLVIKDRILGVITVQSFTENAYDEYHISLLKSLASFVAIAMDNASLYETMEEKVEERTREVTQQKEKLEINYFNTSLLSQIGQLVSSTLKIDEIFDELYEKVNQLMKAEIFAIRIYDEQTNTINFKYTIENGDRCDPFTLKADNPDNYNVWCIRNRKELLINDNLKEYKKYVNEIQVLQGEKPNSLIFYPMIVENKMIGVITIQSFEINAYQPYHLDILKTLAAYIGTVIDNAQLYETLEVKVKERTEELEQKNLDITASINYAKRLQKGILPSRSFMQQLLPESFVLFRPKDIVSGDFYWVDRTSSRILFAVVDCTGHGVPGAMMSIIGRNLLDQAVNEKGITIPSQILNFLQVGLSVAFGQTNNTKTELFDGMDLAICSLNLSTMKLNFAGANSSLYLIQDNELITLKGDKYGVTAEFEQFESYNNIEIDVNKGDRIYLSSDGFPDQFGGPKQKKFTYRRFQQLISNVQQYNMKEQHEIFNTTLDNWQGDLEQTDDICILGVMI